ncbi:amino acid--tRNA ligase-related protein [Verrucomicrobiota bacterium]
MPDLITISELSDHEGNEVTLRGWLSGKRSGGKIVFLQMRDGTGICQCVAEAAVPEAFDTASKLTQETSFSVSGTVQKDTRSAGGYEITVSSIEIIHSAEDYPITRKVHGIDFLMSHRHLWLRSRRTVAIMKIRHTLIKACRDFFDNHDFTLIDTPILTSGAGEDTQTLFPLKYFDQKAFLAQTGQLYLESACMALRKVYCFGPTFRAEKSKTRRHLTEFWMIEPEAAFAELDDIIELAEDMVCYVLEQVLARHEEELRLLGRNIEVLRLIKKPFVRMTYTEAAENLRSDKTLKSLEHEFAQDKQKLQEWIDKLKALEQKHDEVKKDHQKDKLQIQINELKESIHESEADLRNRPAHIKLAQSFEWGKDLGGSDETILSRQFDKPVFVTHYPKEAKAFYMKTDPDNKKVALNMDLLAPEGYGEIIGGSQREDDIDVLEDKIKAKGLDPEDYQWYLDLRRYGSVPHGGFGLGIERALAWICGLKHVREAIPFPRTMGRMEP